MNDVQVLGVDRVSILFEPYILAQRVVACGMSLHVHPLSGCFSLGFNALALYAYVCIARAFGSVCRACSCERRDPLTFWLIRGSVRKSQMLCVRYQGHLPQAFRSRPPLDISTMLCAAGAGDLERDSRVAVRGERGRSAPDAGAARVVASVRSAAERSLP